LATSLRSDQEHDPNGRPDRRRRLLAVRSHRLYEPVLREPRCPLQTQHGQRGAALRQREHGSSRRVDRLLERQVPLQLLASESGDREADSDGNPATVADPNWESLFATATQTTPPLATPPFPDHPSGHGCLSGAVLQTLTDFFGRDKVAFTVVSGRTLNGTPIPPRRFLSFSQARQEIIDARVWVGIHFRTADRQGAWLGRQLARNIRKNYFLPVS
jgi:hypothetical protein